MKPLRLLFVVALFAVPAFAQLHESITVEVVDVPVYVYNGTTPVRNLTKDNFELFVNGKPQPIEYFDTVDFLTTPGAGATASEPQPAVTRDPRDRRMFLILFDLAMSRPAAIARAREAALSMVEHGSPSDYFSIVTWGTRNGTQFVSTFTNDHDSLRRALKSLAPASAHDPLAIASASITRDSSRMLTQGQFGQTMADASAMPEKRLIEAQLNDFADIADRVKELEGYKHVVVFSEGVNPAMIYGSWHVEPWLMNVLTEMIGAFRSAGAVVDTVDIGSNMRSSSAPDVLRVMARETGGQFIHWQNDFKAAVAQIANTTSTVYRLGFRSSNPGVKYGDNAVEVKLRNVPRGTTLSFRRGFSTAKEMLPQGYDSLRLADIIINEIPQNGIPASVALDHRELVVTIPSKTLLASSEGLGVTADLLVYVFDKSGTALQFLQKQVVLTQNDPQLSDVVVREPLKLTAGDYVVKALLRARKSIGFTRQAITID